MAAPAGVSSALAMPSTGSSFSTARVGARTLLNSLKTAYTASTSAEAYNSVILAAISRATANSTRARTFTYSPANSYPRLRKASRPFLPTGRTRIFFSALARMTSCALRRTFVLNAPHSPRSPASTTTRTFCLRRFVSSGCWGFSIRAIVERRTRAISLAYGRAERARSCARRKRAAATNFIARVICWVFFTVRMRRRKSRSVGTVGRQKLSSTRRRRSRAEALLESVNGPLHLRAKIIVERLPRGDVLQHGGILCHVETQRTRYLAHGLDLRVSSHAAHGYAGVDRRANARVEKVGLEIDLAVRDGDYICRDIGGDVSRLSFDDREGGERAAAELVV